ncbi:MAG: hypothetical protein ACK4UN_11185, partial [Limisphaerales bacterium]
PSVPQLTPLNISHPENHFDPSAPWHLTLDPAANGFSFNRQYGFVMSATSDPIPPGTAIWFRQLSSSPGLETFRYRATEPKTWEPLFGPDGTNLFQWSMTMFHPAYACPPYPGTHTAEYEALLVNTSTGTAVANQASARFTLTWTVAGLSKPCLEITGSTISWPAAANGCALESAPNLNGPWSMVTNAPVLAGEKMNVAIDPEWGNRFYRLCHKMPAANEGK